MQKLLFDKYFFKFMNNAVFGKTLGNFVGYRNEKRLKST